MTRYAQHISPQKTPQTEPVDSRQQKNNAGGYSFVLDQWKQLDRWLILGSEGGTYYVSERKLTKDNAKIVEKCLDADYKRTIDRIVEISQGGKAPKNDPAIFALALAAGHKNPEVRRYALGNLSKVCRIGTHLFQFVESVKAVRGWGRALRRSISNWYTEKSPEDLAYQLLKYQQRGGWSHANVLRLIHPRSSQAHSTLFRWVVSPREGYGAREIIKYAGKANKAQGKPFLYSGVNALLLPPLLAYYEELKKERDPKRIANLIREYGYTHEMVPNEVKNSVEVWEALNEKMPITATLRNLAKMTSVGLIKPLSSASKRIIERITNPDILRKGRVHPLAVLSTLRVYAQGHGDKGSLTWKPDQRIVDALNDAFYLAFDAIEPTGKNLLLALDVSGSMGSSAPGISGCTCRDVAAVMAMATARLERNWHIVGFSTHLMDLTISPKQRLDDVVRYMDYLPFGGTDCSLPMIHAEQQKWEVDGFYVITDNETWAGSVHPHIALKNYRKRMGRASKLAVAAVQATQFTIADPSDAGMMDVVGFATDTPAVVANFFRD